MPASDQALDGEKRLFWVCDSLTFCSLTNKPFLFISECDHGRCRTRALGIFDDACVFPIHNSDA